MSDLFQGQSMSAAYQFVSHGTAHTFKFPFQPDKVILNNLTEWTGTAAGKPQSVWFRDQTTAGHAYQEQVIEDSGSANIFNFLQPTTNGFTVADTLGGPNNCHSLISGITQADPCVVTHDTAVVFQNNQVVRLTNLGNYGVGTNGMDELNNNRYSIVVLGSTTFSLKDVITGEPIDSTSFAAYVSGGIITLETNVITLNNPQVYPYSPVTPYDPNPYQYDPIQYQLTAGTAVMGSSGDVYLLEVYKFGQVYNLGTFTI